MSNYLFSIPGKEASQGAIIRRHPGTAPMSAKAGGENQSAISSYFISIPRKGAPKDGTIHDPDTKLKIKAYDLLKFRFNPSKGEVSFFVTTANEKLAFETKGYKKQRKLLILQMIARYCLYLGLVEAQIHSTWPW
jgi:hypothetical protein